MRWKFWKKPEPRRQRELFHTDYPPTDAEEGDLWYAPMYQVNPWMWQGDIYSFKNGDWNRISVGKHDDFPWKHNREDLI